MLSASMGITSPGEVSHAALEPAMPFVALLGTVVATIARLFEPRSARAEVLVPVRTRQRRRR